MPARRRLQALRIRLFVEGSGRLPRDPVTELGLAWTKPIEADLGKELPLRQQQAIIPLLQAYSEAETARFRCSTPGIDAPSEMVRNDVIFLAQGQLNRAWAERVYVGLADDQGKVEVKGFVHVRTQELLDALKGHADPNQPIPSLVEAYLACPDTLRPEEGAGHIVEDDLAGYLYGDPFVSCPVTPYCRPHQLFAGVCAHAAAHMCLALRCRRDGGGALGTFDIHRIACGGDAAARSRVFGVGGLSPAQVARVFSSPWTGLGAVHQVCGIADSYRPLAGDGQTRLATRKAVGSTILGFLDSDCPVVLAVHNDRWTDVVYGLPAEPGAAEEPAVGPPPGRRHSVVIVGYRLEETGRVTLIVHDSAARAFLTAELYSALEAAEAFDPGGAAERGRPNRVHIVVPVPQGVVVDPIQAALEVWLSGLCPPGPWGRGLRSRQAFLGSVSYRLLPVTALADALVRTLRLDASKRPAAREMQACLEDEGIAHLWQVVPREGEVPLFAAYVDASTYTFGRRPASQRLSPVVIADPARGLVVEHPGGTGSDTWLFTA
jgi:hypothetical protein